MARRRIPLARTHQPYSIADAAELYGCHRNTVRLWLRQGLEPIAPTKPILIHGTALNAFHAARRTKGRRPCQPGEIYCLPCRKPQRPAGGAFEVEQITPTTWKVTAICPECDRLMHQRVNAARLAAFEEQSGEADGGKDN